MKSANWIIGILVLIALAGFAASLSRGVEGRAQRADSADSEAPTTAPDFTLEKLGGGTVTLSDYKGKKPVILDFWATWCPNCRRDIPRLNAFYQKYKDKVEVIGVDLQEEPSIVQKFVSDIGITYPVVLDPQSYASQKYQVRYTNYHILINKNGEIVGAVPGDISESDFTKLITL